MGDSKAPKNDIYLAPERAKREMLFDGQKADIWSCGVVLF
jgi:hypothetical protein